MILDNMPIDPRLLKEIQNNEVVAVYLWHDVISADDVTTLCDSLASNSSVRFLGLNLRRHKLDNVKTIAKKIVELLSKNRNLLSFTGTERDTASWEKIQMRLFVNIVNNDLACKDLEEGELDEPIIPMEKNIAPDVVMPKMIQHATKKFCLIPEVVQEEFKAFYSEFESLVDDIYKTRQCDMVRLAKLYADHHELILLNDTSELVQKYHFEVTSLLKPQFEVF